MRRFVRHIATALVTALMVSLLPSCGDDFRYSSSPCYLVFDNSIHQNAILATAMNQLSTGVFCKIQLANSGQAFIFENNHGLKDSKPEPFNGIDQKYPPRLGKNNGIIVGFGSTGEFYAFDLQCPYCFSDYADRVIARPLQMTEIGIAKCSVCESEYDMRYGGYCLNPKMKGHPGMTEYRGSTTGPLGILNVHSIRR